MGAVYFYHLTQSPLEVTLSMLTGKARAAGWRVAVRGTSADRLAWLDEKLWVMSGENFDPHGMAGGEFDAEQPILLTLASEMTNGATCLMAIDSAPVDPEEVGDLDRVCVLFDGNDPDSLAAARAQWKTLTQAGCAAQYWAQSSGSWEKRAESGT